ncbi:carbonic anhydrase [Schizophyllum commune H4-8]|uniref:Carbonic anhydrase n=1 Tax=Schizophyllum commune (strain H4-8 / FGSC 9210) TaxID=578458 RepID=D8PQP3_SCHCM|nr:carbonic anhydrase [Schizophyllum commune H4-8]KAI5898168.1 carbonic anhydrase [Schizophyllum commune H4-8]
MSVHELYAQNNEKYAAAFDKGSLPMPPAKHVAIVTCMDARVEPASQLGINLGDAHVIRNAGGRAQDAIRNLIISQRLLGTREIIVFHHTDCGMLTFTTDQLKQIVKDASPGDSAVASAVDKFDSFLDFKDLEGSVREDVDFLKSHPLILKDTPVTGWIYDVKSGKILRVV